MYNLGYAPLWYAFLSRLSFSVQLSNTERAALKQIVDAIHAEMEGKLPVDLERGEGARLFWQAHAAFSEQKKRWSRTLN